MGETRIVRSTGDLYFQNVPDAPPARWGEFLAHARAESFVGRSHELQWFDSFLNDPQRRLLHIYGRGGIGKSALLQRFALQAEDRSLRIGFIHAGDVGTRPQDVRAAFARYQSAAIWLVDNLEHWRVLDGWLRSDFLPHVPLTVRIVTAGRQPLGSAWKTDPGWSELCVEKRLEGLNTKESMELLNRRGVSLSDASSMVDNSGGSPLLLLLSAAATRRGRDSEDLEGVVSALVERMVSESQGANHRDALFLSAFVPWVAEELLCNALGEETGFSLLRWLQSLPGFLRSARGVAPHDLVRDALLTFVTQTAPQKGRLLARLAQQHYVRLVTSSPTEAGRGMHDLAMVLRHEPCAAAFGFSHMDGTYPSQLRPSDHGQLLDACNAFEGEASARKLRRWFQHYPTDFVIARAEDGRPLGYTFTPSCSALHDEERNDEGFQRLFEWLDQWLPGDGANVRAMRAWLVVESGHGTSAAQGCLAAEHWRSTAFTDGVVAVSGPDPSPFTAVWDMFADVKGPTFLAGDVRFRWWAHDRRSGSPSIWLERVCRVVRDATDHQEQLAGNEVHDTEELNAPPPPTQAEITRAGREALRSFHDEARLASSTFAGWVTPATSSHQEKAEYVRELLRKYCSEEGLLGRDAELARVLTVTFLEEPRKQLAAARALHMSFGTYRRRLSEAIERLSERLARHLGGP